MPPARKRSKKATLKLARAAKVLKASSAEKSTDKVAGPSSSKLGVRPKPDREKFPEGYRLIDLSILESLFKEAKCAHCRNGYLKLREVTDSLKGLATLLELTCSNCSWRKAEYSSHQLDDRTYDVNMRAVHGFTSTGLGLTKIHDVFTALNHPRPFSTSTFAVLLNKIVEAAKVVCEGSMKQAADEVRLLKGVSESDMCECSVMLDGTWQKRGHSSRYGVVSAISVDNVKVVDCEMLSSLCVMCEKKEKLGTPSEEFESWYAGHKDDCRQNYVGSAPNMEPVGVARIFERSREKRNLEYLGYVGDGDTKSYASVKDKKIYGEKEIVKKECVGHVQKRVGKRLRDLKSKLSGQKLSDGKTIGGKGRLTEEVIGKLQRYYGLAIRRHKGDVEGMKRAIWATLDHMTSTDDLPQHSGCPLGENSWCKYNAHKYLVESGETVTEFHHKAPLPAAVVAKLLPVYTSLTDQNLLERCVDGQTQNACESFNSLVWSRCPKERYCGAQSVLLAVCNAVCVFNDGRCSGMKVLGKLGLSHGKNYEQYLLERDCDRVDESEKRMSELEKKKRESARRRFKANQELFMLDEGVTYCPGGF